jgi:uncharacterized membrane protein YkgB
MTIDLRKHAARPEYEHARMPNAPRAETHTDVPRARMQPKRSREKLVMLVAAGAIALIVLILVIFGITKAWGALFGGTEYEMKSLVADVGEHMLLPENETPTLATVSDLHALEGQMFFRNAAVGDKVLMYLVSQQAILYRPSIDKIIEVGPITGSAQ